jgi:hypothetical protein
LLISIGKEPNLVREVVDSTESKIWKDTMVEEMESLHKNETWDLTELRNGRKLISRKWLFKKKMNAASQVKTFKPQSVSKGYS